MIIILKKNQSWFAVNPISTIKSGLAANKEKSPQRAAEASCNNPTGRAKGCICYDDEMNSTQCASHQCFHRQCL